MIVRQQLEELRNLVELCLEFESIHNSLNIIETKEFTEVQNEMIYNIKSKSQYIFTLANLDKREQYFLIFNFDKYFSEVAGLKMKKSSYEIDDETEQRFKNFCNKKSLRIKTTRAVALRYFVDIMDNGNA